MSILGRFKPRQLVHHVFYSEGAGDQAIALQTNNKDTGATVGLMNLGFPKAAKATRLWLNTATLGVIVAGDWTVRLRVNRSGSDSATFTYNPTGTDEVFSGPWSSEVILRPTDQYHLLTDGGQRNLILVRAVLEFEIL